MTIKEKKAIANAILSKMEKSSLKPKVKVECVGIVFHEKGQFFSLLINVEASHKTEDGEFLFLKDVQLPISITNDISVSEEKPVKVRRTRVKKTV